MQTFLLVITVVLIMTIGLMLQRLFRGPTIFDRMNGLGVITADTILLIVIFGFLDKQPGMYVDLALAYAMMGCLGSVILAKYLGGKKL
ncbi:MAG: pH regulation protein F [Acidaminococcaceae bacterium]|nr:pH regulation protein F [Acidaminococcaceae bacterium]MBQ9635128.1 pH regulation protein F [Acidaminococcaceae bacterium]MBQ9697289.1 pH regulation protein F [Acidaminococcaceae bacterium]MBR1590654.1 pH regulation protein F [Acidaminococcaceae bacterium]